jgi:hypothetical protein
MEKLQRTLEDMGHARAPRDGNIHESSVAPTAQTCMKSISTNQSGPPRSVCASSEEPGAVIAPAGICEGGASGKTGVPTSIARKLNIKYFLAQ